MVTLYHNNYIIYTPPNGAKYFIQCHNTVSCMTIYIIAYVANNNLIKVIDHPESKRTKMHTHQISFSKQLEA